LIFRVNRAIHHATRKGNRANQAFALGVLQQPLASDRQLACAIYLTLLDLGHKDHLD
jgi:hypothetical protein